MKTLKIFTTIFILSLIAIVTVAQQKTEIRNVTKFSSIDVSEGIKVELTYGDKEFVEVTADEDYIDKVITQVNGNELNIYMKGINWSDWNRKVLVKVTATKVELIDASSGSSVISQNLIESDELEMSLSSGANIKIAFKTLKASCNASSGAGAKLKGITENFNTVASSGSSINAKEVKAINVNADVSSGANINIYVTKKLEADASSGGSIRYSGNPKMVDIDKSSGGSVHKN